MLELHTAKLDSLCADGTKLSKKKQYLGQTTFEYSIEVLVLSQRHVENCPEVNGLLSPCQITPFENANRWLGKIHSKLRKGTF